MQESAQVVRWIVAAFCFASWFFLVSLQPFLIMREFRRKRARGEAGGVSGIWLIGSLIGVVGLCIMPKPRWWSYWWLALPPLLEATTLGAFAIAGMRKNRGRSS